MKREEIGHIPVLSHKLAEQINLPPDGVMVDSTIGHGGHSYLFGQRLGPGGVLVGIDVDKRSLEEAKERLRGLKCRVLLVNSNFIEIGRVLEKEGTGQADFVLADLGVSSGQLADEEAGLSFQQDMPLDMRLDKSLKATAADIVNKTDEKSLADLIYRYGEERASRRIARFIVRGRQGRPITTTGELSEIVCRAMGRRGGRIHPATRTFQALRIAVNDELENLRRFLEALPTVLKSGGFVAVISFHSLEDRIVKRDFLENSRSGIYRIVTKKPMAADREEALENRRARSAKLRIAQKI